MQTSPYAVPIEQLEAATRFRPEEQVQEVDAAPVPDLDPGPPHPDREWFAAGG